MLDHPGFRAFWEGLRLTSNKYKVIRRGERGFGLALTAAGISFGPLFPQAGFDAALVGMDASALRQVLGYMASVDPTEAAEGAALSRAPDTPEWERQAATSSPACLPRRRSTVPFRFWRRASWAIRC